LENDKPTDA